MGHHAGEDVGVIAPLAGFAMRVALGGAVVGDLPQCLVDRQPHQQLEQVVLAVEGELIVADADEEGAERRLDHVLGIDAAGHPLTDPPLGQAHQLLAVAVEQLPGGGLAARSELLDQIPIIGRMVGHGEPRGPGPFH